MASKNRILGRNRGTWAANTFYFRDDVVRYLGALYNANADFTSGVSFNAANWTMILDAVNTLASLGGSKITQGAGLPAFAGRLPNDLHYDNTTGKTHILSGVAGTSFSDTFGTDGALSGSYTQSPSSGWAVSGGRAVMSGTNNVLASVALGAGVTHDASADVVFGNQSSFGNAGLEIKAGAVNTGYYFANLGGANYYILRTGSGVISAVSTSAPNTTRNMRIAATAAGVVTAYLDNVQIMSYTDGSPLTGVNAGFRANDTSTVTTAIDNFYALDPGTLQWTYNEPLYLSCVVPGTVTVGTHVFKPGLRIPTGPTTVRQLVIRTDTAATAGGITVVGTRFNNGVSTGQTITATIASGATVGSTTAAIACAQGDMWKFDVTVANGGSDLLINLDCF